MMNFVAQLMVTMILSTCRRFNPLSPNSYQQQFSPNNIHTLSRDKVMRNDHHRENSMIFSQILSTNS